MSSVLHTLTVVAALSSSVLAHFELHIPETIGFSDEKEATAPCGGFDVTSRDKVSDFQVDGSAISVNTGHPSTVWFIRGALLNDTGNFQDFGPQIYEIGQGDFCVPEIKAPKEWAGQDGVIQVMQQGHHGMLYQCAAVKFTEGKASSFPEGCKNSSSKITAVFTSAAPLPAETGGHHDGESSTDSANISSASGTQSRASASSTSNSGAAQVVVNLGSALVAGVLALLLA